MLPGDRQDRAEGRGAYTMALATFTLITGIIWLSPGEIKQQLLATGAAVAIAGGVYLWASRKHRRRNQLLRKPFPASWRSILQNEVAFYQGLDDAGKARFEQMVVLFLDETRITPIKTEVDDRIRILVAASGIIPVFGLDGWEYFNLGEILIVPDSWKLEHSASGAGVALGQVQGFQNKQFMRLSKAALEKGFSDLKDRKNVGIHEFAHVLDAADGEIDGIPAMFLPKQFHKKWKEIMAAEMQKIRSGHSRIRRYGGTNEAEFFAVTTEYFFENPQLLQKENPVLYKLLTSVYNQNPGTVIDLNLNHYFFPYGKKIGRNSACPCGSGEKYKKCCLE